MVKLTDIGDIFETARDVLDIADDVFGIRSRGGLLGDIVRLPFLRRTSSQGFNVQEFKSVVDGNGGIMPINKFLVEFPVPRGLQRHINPYSGGRSGTLSFYCKSASLPGIGIMTSDIHRYGYGPIERKPYTTVYNDMTMVMYVDTENKIRQWMNYWLRTIINFGSANGMDKGVRFRGSGAAPYEFSYKEDYAVDVTITSFDGTGKPAVRVTLIEAYPTFMQDVYLDWDAKNQLMLLPVALTYKDWVEESLDRDIFPRVRVENPETGEYYPEP